MEQRLPVAIVVWLLGAACLALGLFGGRNLGAPQFYDSTDWRARRDQRRWRADPRGYITRQRVGLVLGALFCAGLGLWLLRYGR